ncbi:LOW QUALITY PROTEIN: tubulin monoglutamylase TTLL4 [Musca vetustissima]|uniref:LOW QUALITY PROTEIN: tubulin monoglutamylase TTLL4 n=1 Tax=Musca vetustissima TaxID=27455 RepID=UPI002AB7A4EA|nr:LOW QUALITY PROTEIN: tubulin monoglutamylase TTLL4 [Musca vetustissima]
MSNQQQSLQQQQQQAVRSNGLVVASPNVKGLEIKDFHESWLEEMEVYKDMMHVPKQKHVPHQLLGSHNHAHTPQGCQIDVVVNTHQHHNPQQQHHHQHQHQHNSSANKMSSHLMATTNPKAANNNNNKSISSETNTTAATTTTIVTNGNVKRRNVNDNSKTNNTRVKVTPTLAAATAAASADTAKHGKSQAASGGHQRPREETPTKKSGTGSGAKSNSPNATNPTSHHTAKRSSGHSSTNETTNIAGVKQNHNNTAPLSPGKVKNPTRATTTKSPTAVAADTAVSNKNAINSTSAYAAAPPTAMPSAPSPFQLAYSPLPLSSPKHNAKIIVNQFHASSLLNGHQLEEKEKILTLNGLNQHHHHAAKAATSASAYEASFYAANYLNSDKAHTNNMPANGMPTNRPRGDGPNNGTNYLGVSLANQGIVNGTTTNHDGSEFADDDDPSAAIDDVNPDTDSDFEEDYVGEPFHLEEDGDETLQSKTKPYVYYTPTTILSPSLFPNVAPYLNYSSHAERGPPMPAQLHKILKWKLSIAMPKIVKRVVLNSGFRIIKNTTDWMAVWEKHMKSPGFRTIRSHQKYNHMPGSFRIGRKDSMWRSINDKMKKFGKKEFGFMQKSYVMPEELELLRKAWPRNVARRTKWIVKPPASARGTGISIVNKWSQFPKDLPLVVQKYIERPLLINDNKFDMRIYVVLTSINPLRLYMYKDGLARFASVKYSSELNSLDDVCMHLTNYSINKFSESYDKNEDVNACQGHKWTLQSLWSCLEERGVNTKRLWATLRNLVIKALISGEAGLNRMYRQNVNFRYNCFELFGFDVLLDENLVPWLLEINISPSLHSDLPLDLHVKGPLIQAVLNTALYQVPPKLNEKQQKDILEELKLEGPLCFDRRLFTTCLRNEEIRKHNQFTNRSIEVREDYLEPILENLLPDDVRCLLLSEDELNRCSPLERIFPTPNTYHYLKFVDNPRYYNRLLDAWEHRYGHCREKGIELLRQYCRDNYHLIVAEAAFEKEPQSKVTEIDVMHVKKEEPTADDANATDGNIPVPVLNFNSTDITKEGTEAAPENSKILNNNTDATTTTTNTLNTTKTIAATTNKEIPQSKDVSNSTKLANHQPTNQKETNSKMTPNKMKQQETLTERKLKTDIKAS